MVSQWSTRSGNCKLSVLARWWDEGKMKILHDLWFTNDRLPCFCNTVSCFADVYSTALHIWTRESPRGVFHPIRLATSTLQMVWRFFLFMFELCRSWGLLNSSSLFFFYCNFCWLPFNMVFLLRACFWFENSVSSVNSNSTQQL